MTSRTESNASATGAIYLGLFLIALATLMHEILLTRIFSVAMWYHFAFMAVSVAMFWMTVGALVVYLKPGWFDQPRVTEHLSRHARHFSLSLVVSFMIYVFIPFGSDKLAELFLGVISLASIYAVIAVPFIFSGICVCLSLTRFPGEIARLYAADLA